ncbi:dihydroorotate dehydrogenase electron transfer subunit [Lapidilactobacillus luobeiensis]|uniref:dihydroorotate dehydrogenase electron transfer subunit n=1 Tax=Lapidilactobacillus luobeiensis TaxID=2950371 RepID=UPI0021C3A8F5|nr:dihydroorotate dehydrogenase electron transfer subunit [Lapidilactobacillus luobeiensis]
MIQEQMTIVRQQQLTDDVYELVLAGAMARLPWTPGQFVEVQVPDPRLLLRRPFGVAALDPAQGQLTLLYKTIGAGTAALSQARPGEKLAVLGPLGHGFPSDFLQAGEQALLIGGGTGIPPLYALGRQLHQQGIQITSALGFVTKSQFFYQAEFAALGDLACATNDGSLGFCGHLGLLLDAQFADAQTRFAAIYACGPTGLLMAVNNRYREHPHAYISLESRMACGVGECYACVVPAASDAVTTAVYKVCDEGPVFATGEVKL